MKFTLRFLFLIVMPVPSDVHVGILFISGMKLEVIHNADHLFELLKKGNNNRTQHPTDANAESSRSHAVFQVSKLKMQLFYYYNSIKKARWFEFQSRQLFIKASLSNIVIKKKMITFCCCCKLKISVCLLLSALHSINGFFFKYILFTFLYSFSQRIGW